MLRADGGVARVLLLAGCAALAASAPLLWPRWGASGARSLDVVVLDRSASVVRTRSAWPQWARGRLERAAREARAEGADLLVVACARDVVRAFGPARPAAEEAARAAVPLAPPADGATDLAGAFALALSEAGSARPLGRVLCLSDGRFTGASPERALAAIVARAARIEVEEPPAPDRADLALAELRAPARAEARSPLAADVLLALSGVERASVRLDVELSRPGSPAAPRTWRIEREVARADLRGGALVRLDLGSAQEGGNRLRVRAEIAGGDPVAENDAREAWIEVGDALGIGVVGGSESARDAARWAQALRAQGGLDVRVLDPSDLAAALPRLDALACVDAEAQVLERAGAFAAAGGGVAVFLGAEALAAAELPAFLPLVPVDPESAPRDVVLLADGSGSMAGEPFEALRRAALELARAAPPRDELSLRLFTQRLLPEVRVSLSRGGNSGGSRERSVEGLLAARAPGGPTDIAGSLRELAAERERPPVNAREALGLLLTDGRDQRADPQELRALRARLAAARVRLAVFPFGAQADREFLRGLLFGGEELLVAGDGEAVARLLRREVERERLREGGPLVAADPSTLEEGGTARELARDLALLGATPEHERHVRCRAAEDAQVIARSREGDPLVAWRAEGLGQVLAVAFAPTAGFAEPWIERAELAGSWITALGRGAAARRAAGIEARLEERELIVSGVPPQWPARVAVELRPMDLRQMDLRQMDPGAREPARAELAIPIEEPGGDPRTVRRGRLSEDVPDGAWAVRLSEVGKPGSPPLAELILVTAGPDQEFAMRSPRLGRPPDAAPRSPLRADGGALALALPLLALGLVLAGAGGVLLLRRGSFFSPPRERPIRPPA